MTGWPNRCVKGVVMVPESKIKAAVDILVKSCSPKKIILFGSQARGEANEDSDVDLLVIEDVVVDPGREMVRLSRELSKIRFYADLIVVSASYYQYWRETPGNIYFEADAEGKVLYEQAG